MGGQEASQRQTTPTGESHQPEKLRACAYLEVEGLTGIDNIERTAEVVLVVAVISRCQVTRCVERGAVLTLDEHRLLETKAGQVNDSCSCTDC